VHWQEDAKRQAAEATNLGPRRLKRHAMALAALRADSQRLTAEHAAAQERADIAAQAGDTEKSPRGDADKCPAGDSAAVTELHISTAELSLRTTEQQLAKLDAAARAVAQAQQAQAQHSALRDQLTTLTSAIGAEGSKLAKVHEDLQENLRVRDSLNERVHHARVSGGTSTMLPHALAQVRLQTSGGGAPAASSRHFAAVVAVTDNRAVFGSVAQLATCTTFHAFVPLNLVLRNALLNDVVVEDRAAAIRVSRHVCCRLACVAASYSGRIA
jgi:chromosome segregation ATPase